MILLTEQSMARTVLTGVVKTMEGNGMDFISVVAYSSETSNKILSSTFTDETGQFQITVTSDCDSLLLKATGVEIAPATIKIPNRPGIYDITVENKAIELKEIVVKSRKIYSDSDTINYNVASFLSQNDRVLADVLKKMPGISVDETGQVSYQGKPIKNFYIEGLDLMKGHYGIATNNIDPTDIATVQVLENHQDIKALKGLRPEEQASINIRLKEGVKGVFNLITTLGGGYGGQVLWDNSAMATYFKRSSQFLATYKGNNTGEDLSQELYSLDNDHAHTSNITNISMPPVPGIDRRFYNFNRSHSVTFNNVYRMGNYGELGINAAFLNDRDSRHSYSRTANTLPDGEINVVDEIMNGVSKTDKAYGDFTYILNNDRHYLKEQLKFDWFSTNADSHITASGDDVSQTGRTDSYRLFNKLHVTSRSSEYRGFEIFSTINLEKRPHSLFVSPNLFSGLVKGGVLHQNVDYRDLSTENRFGLLSVWKIGNVSIHPACFINYSRNNLTSELSELSNNLWLGNFSTGINVELYWRHRKVNATLGVPLGYRLFNLKHRFTDAGINKGGLRVEPQFDFSYKINGSNNLSLKSSLNYSTPSIQNLYSNYILTSYRQLSVYNVEGLFEGINLNNTISYNFKNILAMSFAGIDLIWNKQKPDVLYGTYYDGLVERVISRRTKETSDMFSATIHGSQGFDWRRLKIGISASYSFYTSPLLVQNSVIRYSGNTVGVNGDISFTPFKWLSASYEGEYYQSVSRQKGFDPMPWIRTLSNKVVLDFNFSAGVSLRTSLYHYYNNFNEGDKSFLLLNAEVRYSVKRFSFAITCDNLMNRNEYVYSSHSALTESYSRYDIRPRSILLKIRFRIL